MGCRGIRDLLDSSSGLEFEKLSLAEEAWSQGMGDFSGDETVLPSGLDVTSLRDKVGKSAVAASPSAM